MRYDDCEMRNNGDGVKPIYQQREQRNKLALKNLETGMKGKLGKLNNLQLFNFNISAFSTATTNNFAATYNTTNAFPANCTQTVMFGISGLTGKALFYNIVGISIVFNNTAATTQIRMRYDSYVQFYTLQNINGSASSLGTKIPQPAPLYGNGGGSVTYTTTGNIEGHQYLSADFLSDYNPIPQNTLGLRASGLALKSIVLNFYDGEDLTNLSIDVQVYVDISSVSSGY